MCFLVGVVAGCAGTLGYVVWIVLCDEIFHFPWEEYELAETQGKFQISSNFGSMVLICSNFLGEVFIFDDIFYFNFTNKIC